MEFYAIDVNLPITGATRFEAWTVFVRSNTGVVGSKPTWGMDICVYLCYPV
jgi:hypothetical protein